MLSGANVEYDLPIPIKDESETLSDIDDAELDVYIHNEKEKNMKKTLWERAYREYLEELLAAEKAAAAAAGIGTDRYGPLAKRLTKQG
ncbi:hypothetical protein JHK82_045962 [Glycine max]|nr:hypothetical protein JHK85_044891 [Glycine max]KAG5100910.1 hypothetical protein JHK82_045962 [Glycine max]